MRIILEQLCKLPRLPRLALAVEVLGKSAVGGIAQEYEDFCMRVVVRDALCGFLGDAVGSGDFAALLAGRALREETRDKRFLALGIQRILVEVESFLSLGEAYLWVLGEALGDPGRPTARETDADEIHREGCIVHFAVFSSKKSPIASASRPVEK